MDSRQDIPVQGTALDPALEATMRNVAEQLAPSSRKTYAHDARHFACWMADHQQPLHILTRDDLVAYRASLADTYAKTTAARMWAVAGRFLEEAVRRNFLVSNPAVGIREFNTRDDESPHHALLREEARALLNAIKRHIALGARDYALLSLLLRTGLRRAEVAALTVGDLTLEQGYHIAMIRQGKGNKRGIAKVPIDVRQALDRHLAMAGCSAAAPTAPLFVSFRQGDHPQERPLTGNEIERIVKRRAQVVGMALSPHELRISFITLAFEGGANLTLVQDAARHKDPLTTRRYQKQKENLHRNAVDFV